MANKYLDQAGLQHYTQLVQGMADGDTIEYGTVKGESGKKLHVARIPDGSVGTSALASSSITTEKYADGSVTYAKLEDDITKVITQPQIGKDLGAYTWQEFMQLVNDPANGADDFAYMVGQTKSLQISGYGDFVFRIIGVGQDVRASDSQPAKITFMIEDVLANHRMNASNTTTGGWASSEMRSWLNSTILNALPQYIVDGIIEVKKKYKNGADGSIQTCNDKLWILSEKELTGTTTHGDEGEFYEYWTLNNSADARVKRLNISASRWWLRSVNNNAMFYAVDQQGKVDYQNAISDRGVVFCFCIG